MISEIFALINDDGNYDILDCESGDSVTQIASSPDIYPVGSSRSCAWEHPAGIVLTLDQVLSLKIEVE